MNWSIQKFILSSVWQWTANTENCFGSEMGRLTGKIVPRIRKSLNCLKIGIIYSSFDLPSCAAWKKKPEICRKRANPTDRIIDIRLNAGDSSTHRFSINFLGIWFSCEILGALKEWNRLRVRLVNRTVMNDWRQSVCRAFETWFNFVCKIDEVECIDQSRLNIGKLPATRLRSVCFGNTCCCSRFSE